MQARDVDCRCGETARPPGLLLKHPAMTGDDNAVG